MLRAFVWALIWLIAELPGGVWRAGLEGLRRWRACLAHNPQGDPVGGVLVGRGERRVAALELEVLGAARARIRCDGEALDDDRLRECYPNPLVGYSTTCSLPA